MKKIQFVFDVTCGSDSQEQVITNIMNSMEAGIKMTFEGGVRLAHKDNKIELQKISKKD